MKLQLALTMMCLLPPTAMADTSAGTVGGLRELCIGTEPTEPCRAYVAGVAYSMLVKGTERKDCVYAPDVLTSDQMVQIFINWANANPKSWSIVAGHGVRKALVGAYPCKE